MESGHCLIANYREILESDSPHSGDDRNSLRQVRRIEMKLSALCGTCRHVPAEARTTTVSELCHMPPETTGANTVIYGDTLTQIGVA